MTTPLEEYSDIAIGRPVPQTHADPQSLVSISARTAFGFIRAQRSPEEIVECLRVQISPSEDGVLEEEPVFEAPDTLNSGIMATAYTTFNRFPKQELRSVQTWPKCLGMSKVQQIPSGDYSIQLHGISTIRWPGKSMAKPNTWVIARPPLNEEEVRSVQRANQESRRNPLRITAYMEAIDQFYIKDFFTRLFRAINAPDQVNAGNIIDQLSRDFPIVQCLAHDEQFMDKLRFILRSEPAVYAREFGTRVQICHATSELYFRVQELMNRCILGKLLKGAVPGRMCDILIGDRPFIV